MEKLFLLYYSGQLGNLLRLKLGITRNNIGEEIKINSSEENSLHECAMELLNSFYEKRKNVKQSK
jgi:hypothetical protein